MRLRVFSPELGSFFRIDAVPAMGGFMGGSED